MSRGQKEMTPGTPPAPLLFSHGLKNGHMARSTSNDNNVIGINNTIAQTYGSDSGPFTFGAPVVTLIPPYFMKEGRRCSPAPKQSGHNGSHTANPWCPHLPVSGPALAPASAPGAAAAPASSALAPTLALAEGQASALASASAWTSDPARASASATAPASESTPTLSLAASLSLSALLQGMPSSLSLVGGAAPVRDGQHPPMAAIGTHSMATPLRGKRGPICSPQGSSSASHAAPDQSRSIQSPSSPLGIGATDYNLYCRPDSDPWQWQDKLSHAVNLGQQPALRQGHGKWQEWGQGGMQGQERSAEFPGTGREAPCLEHEEWGLQVPGRLTNSMEQGPLSLAVSAVVCTIPGRPATWLPKDARLPLSLLELSQGQNIDQAEGSARQGASLTGSSRALIRNWASDSGARAALRVDRTLEGPGNIADQESLLRPVLETLSHVQLASRKMASLAGCSDSDPGNEACSALVAVQERLSVAEENLYGVLKALVTPQKHALDNSATGVVTGSGMTIGQMSGPSQAVSPILDQSSCMENIGKSLSKSLLVEQSQRLDHEEGREETHQRVAEEGQVPCQPGAAASKWLLSPSYCIDSRWQPSSTATHPGVLAGLKAGAPGPSEVHRGALLEEQQEGTLALNSPRDVRPLTSNTPAWSCIDLLEGSRRSVPRSAPEPSVLNPTTSELAAGAIVSRSVLEVVSRGKTLAPSHDGYQWRKYGKKIIKDKEHARAYYRCFEDNCFAKKSMQLLRMCDEEDTHALVTSSAGANMETEELWITAITYENGHNHPQPAPVAQKGQVCRQASGQKAAECSPSGSASSQVSRALLSAGHTSQADAPTGSGPMTITPQPLHKVSTLSGHLPLKVIPRSKWAKELVRDTKGSAPESSSNAGGTKHGDAGTSNRAGKALVSQQGHPLAMSDQLPHEPQPLRSWRSAMPSSCHSNLGQGQDQKQVHLWQTLSHASFTSLPRSAAHHGAWPHASGTTHENTDTSERLQEILRGLSSVPGATSTALTHCQHALNHAAAPGSKEEVPVAHSAIGRQSDDSAVECTALQIPNSNTRLLDNLRYRLPETGISQLLHPILSQNRSQPCTPELTMLGLLGKRPLLLEGPLAGHGHVAIKKQRKNAESAVEANQVELGPATISGQTPVEGHSFPRNTISGGPHSDVVFIEPCARSGNMLASSSMSTAGLEDAADEGEKMQDLKLASCGLRLFGVSLSPGKR